MRQRPASIRPVLAPLILGLTLCAAESPAGPPLVAPPGTPTLPSGMTVNQGSVSASQNGTQLNLITGPNAILQWQDFSIGAGHGVNFQQQSANSQVLNRVSGQNPSYILGSLTSNGRVWLLNPNGVLFGQNARIDVGGLVASTLNLSDADFDSGLYRLQADPAHLGSGIVNQGAITTTYGGQILLISPSIDNSGSLSAPGGSAQLLAGSAVELLDTGLPFFSFKVPLADGQVNAAGSIQARQIDVYGGVVNQQGLIQADSLSIDEQGRIVLSAAQRLDIGGQLRARNGDGRGGDILLRGDHVSVNDGAVIDADGALGGGRILTTTPQDVGLLSSEVLIAQSATLRADASSRGDGGVILLWSQSRTRVLGQLSARGGLQGGNGGFIETSSHGTVHVRQAPQLGAVKGLGGVWLIDPDHIYIEDADDGNGDDDSVIQTEVIEAALNAGSNVTITVLDIDPYDEEYGSITVFGAIEKTAGGDATLTFNATHQIDIYAPISSSAGKLNLVLRPNTDGIGYTTTYLDNSLSLNGGLLDLGNKPLTMASGAIISNANIVGVGALIGFGSEGEVPFNNVHLGAGVGLQMAADNSLLVQNGLTLGGTITGGVLDLGSSTLTLENQSAITQTNIIGTNQALLVLGPGRSSTFNNVQLGGFTGILDAGSQLNIRNQLTLNGSTLLLATVSAGQGGATLNFEGPGPQSLLGSGSIQAGNSNFFVNFGDLEASVGTISSSFGLNVGGGIAIRVIKNELNIDGLMSNNGLILAEGGSRRLRINANEPAFPFVNFNDLRANFGSQLELFGEWSNQGDLIVDGGSIVFRSAFQTSDIGNATRGGFGGYFILGDGAFWDNSDTDYDLAATGHLGTVLFEGSGGIHPTIYGGSIFSSSPTARLQVQSASSAILDDLTLGSGLITTVDSNATLYVDNGLHLAGAELWLDTATGSGDPTQLIITASGLASQHVSGNGRIIAAHFGDQSGGSASIGTQLGGNSIFLFVPGVPSYIIDPGVTIEAQSDTLNITGLDENQGNLLAVGGKLNVAGNQWINSGSIEADGSNASLIDIGSNSGSIRPLNGDIDVQRDPPSPLLNSGDVHVNAGSRFDVLDGLLNTGVVSGSGVIDVSNDRLNNQGTVSPGGGGHTGILSIVGDYSQSASGTLLIEAASATDTDVLDVSGTAGLGGRLLLHLLAGYEPETDDILTVAFYDDRSRVFNFFEAPNSPGSPNLRYRPSRLEILSLAVIPPPTQPQPVDPPPVDPPPVDPPPVDPPPVDPPPVDPPPVDPPPVDPPPVDPPPVDPPPVDPPPVDPPPVDPPPVDPPPVDPPPVNPPPGANEQRADQAVVSNMTKPPVLSIPASHPDSKLPPTRVVDASKALDFENLVHDSSGKSTTRYEDPGRYLLSDGNITVFRNLPLGPLDKDELKLLLDAREAFKDDAFSDAISALEENPDLADFRPCTSLQEADVGRCILTSDLQKTARARQRLAGGRTAPVEATLPLIERKRALVIGLNRYRDPRIPQLTSALPDARAIGDELGARMGYEVTTLKNPTKAEIGRWLNRMALEMTENDSLVIYFAGHGEMVEKTGLGYWIPTDGSSRSPVGWISNADISRWLGLMQSRQVALIIDSCYSGTFAGQNDINSSDTSEQAEAYLNKRSVAVMTSGSDEPVADTGSEGHSLFAWNLLEQIKTLDKWRPGSNLFIAVRDQVERELPQSPRYGAALKAGHQPGGDFLFERRKIGK